MCIRKPHLHNPIPEIQNTPNASAEYIGQTKRALRDSFGEHRRAIQNNTTDAVPQNFNQKGHKLTDIKLIALKLINSKKESIRELVNHFFGIFIKSLEEGRLDCPKYRENQLSRRFFFAVFFFFKFTLAENHPFIFFS